MHSRGCQWRVVKFGVTWGVFLGMTLQGPLLGSRGTADPVGLGFVTKLLKVGSLHVATPTRFDPK